MLADDVDGALAGFHQVLQAVLGFIEPACVSNNEHRRVVVDDLGVGKRSQIGTAPVLGAGAHEADGPRDDGGYEQLVVERRRSAVLVRVDGDVFLGQALAAVVRAVARLPIGVFRLGEFPRRFGIPVWSARFDFFEVAMRVALDVFLGVHFVRHLG